MRRALLTIAIVLVAGSVALALTWIRNMWTGPVVLPQTEARTPPENTLAVGGPRIMDRLDADEALTNPRPASPEVLAEGAQLYGVYCTLCHGATGTGDGQIAQFYRRVPDLSAPYIQNYSDGWMYSILREGGFNMPSYAESLSVDERWALVHYMRTFAAEAGP